MSRIATVTCATLAIALCAPEASVAADPSGIIEQFSGTRDMPDEIPFRAFLTMVRQETHPNESHPLSVIGSALGLAIEDVEQLARVKAVSRYLNQAREKLGQDRVRNSHAAMCSGNRSSLTVEGIAARMNAAEDVERNLLQKYLRSTLNQLSEEEQAHFLQYLHRLKGGISYVKIDNLDFYQQSQIAIEPAFERWCSELEHQLSLQAAVQ